MSISYSLAAYAISIWNFEDKEHEVLSDFADEQDLLNLLADFLTSLRENASHNKEARQLLTVETLEVDKKSRVIRGLIETGEYGSESKLRDADTQMVVYKRKIKEADMLPFYFRIDLPQGTDDGILILQRTGRFCIAPR